MFQIQQSINYESGIETGSNDTASVASSGSRHSVSSGISSHRGGDQDQDVFEVPRTIRFPPAAPTKCYSEVVICKWELCGNEFDSTGKLLDHLKVSKNFGRKIKIQINLNYSKELHTLVSLFRRRLMWKKFFVA